MKNWSNFFCLDNQPEDFEKDVKYIFQLFSFIEYEIAKYQLFMENYFS